MLFNTFDFLLFFVCVTTLFFLIPHRFRWFLLLIASCYFYAAFIPAYLFILFSVITIDYVSALYIERAVGRRRKWILMISILANVAVLAFFKYYNFFVENFNSLWSSWDSSYRAPLLYIVLPIGLSFHTFQAMSYSIEVYRGNQKAERHFGIYALYVMFYPQLVAGPIERPQNILHQFHAEKYFSNSRLWVGLRLMLWGLFKKVVIADRLSILVDRVFDSPADFNSLVLATGVVFFAIQIYCDFSGYSDIAIGAAKVMGFNLMTNFNRPYFAKNIKDFWDRWHISLSTWFRDYIYIPLGGNRVKVGRLYFNLSIVFLLSGFWHGANWTFIVWGAVHAIYLIFYMLVKRNVNLFVLDSTIAGKFVSWFVTFVLVCFAWIFFRAQDLTTAISYIESLVHNTSDLLHFRVPPRGLTLGFGVASYLISIFSILLLILVEYWFSPRMEERLSFVKDTLFCSAVLCAILAFGVFEKQSFIYFQF